MRALGFALSADRVQVSLNITDFHATPLYRVVELIASLARRRGISILRSELVGLIPEAALVAAAEYYLGVIPTPPFIQE